MLIDTPTPTAEMPVRAAVVAPSSAPVAAAAYWLTMLAVYVLQGALWYFPAKEKIVDDGLVAPAGIQKMFDGSLMDSFPGTSVSWGIVGILQGLIVVGLVVSLVRGEFLPGRPKLVLLAAMALGLVVFALLLFGNSMIGEHESVASLATYFGVTAVLMALVSVLGRPGLTR
jgi:hypothetical protein